MSRYVEETATRVPWWEAYARVAVSILLIATALPGPAHARPAGQSAAPETWLVRVTGRLITVDVRDAPLADLLDAIARGGGLTVDGPVPDTRRVTVRLRDAGMDEVLRQILQGLGYALEYSLVRGDAGRIARVPTRLRIFPGGAQTRASGPRSGSGAGPAERQPSPDLAALGATLEAADDIGDKWEAIEILGESEGSEDALPLLRYALTDTDEDVRLAAVDALATLGGAGAADALEIALRDPAGAVREEAVEALEAVGGDRAAMSLLVALQQDDPGLRILAVDALGTLGGSSAHQLLEYAWAADRDESVRTTAEAWLSALRGEDR